METTAAQPVPSPVTPVEENKNEERKKPSFLARYKFTVISLCIILAALVPLILLSKNNKKPTTTTVTQAHVSPTVAPLTQENAVPTLDAVDTKIQTALDQSATDLQASQVNSSQDSTAGL